MVFFFPGKRRHPVAVTAFLLTRSPDLAVRTRHFYLLEGPGRQIPGPVPAGHRPGRPGRRDRGLYDVGTGPRPDTDAGYRPETLRNRHNLSRPRKRESRRLMDSRFRGNDIRQSGALPRIATISGICQSRYKNNLRYHAISYSREMFLEFSHKIIEFSNGNFVTTNYILYRFSLSCLRNATIRRVS